MANDKLMIYLSMGTAALALLWFGARWWLAVNRQPGIRDVPTPTVDRLNARALEHLAGENSEAIEADQAAAENEAAPADLLEALPADERKERDDAPPSA